MSTNFAKTLVWKQDYDVILWRHKQHTPNTNDYPMPLNEATPMKSFCVRHWIVVQPSWTAVPCPTTKLGLLISKPFAGIKQSVIGVALKTPLKTRVGICIYKSSLPHRSDDYIGFTSICPPHILQQNCSHGCGALLHEATIFSQLKNCNLFLGTEWVNL